MSRQEAESCRSAWLRAFRVRDLPEAAAIRKRLLDGGWVMGTRPPYPMRPRQAGAAPTGRSEVGE